MTYNPTEIERKIYEKWEKELSFKAPLRKNKNSFCITLPPPNVTGSLHMGHAFQNVIMDSYSRYYRLNDCDVLWQPGTDHAGIATQLVVEQLLKKEGISKDEIGREAFLDRVWHWRNESGEKIMSQMKRLGSSVDWERAKFTMDPDVSEVVAKTFVTLYEEGLIYRGKRLVNWDTSLKTALSDLEVISIEEEVKLYDIKYRIKGSDEFLTVSTTRPETLFGDVAIATNPNDSRFKHMIGKNALIPISNKEIPIIGDDYVDMEFGSGCLKITPGHDFNDFEIGKRHNLIPISIFDEAGITNENVPNEFQGQTVQNAREKVVTQLKACGQLEKVKPYKTMIPRGDRSNVIVEPMLTEQWYMAMEKLAKPAIAAVKQEKIKFTPHNWSKTYFNWMNDIQDWCISRQLWWGHRIPAWYDLDDNIYVGLNLEEIQQKYQLDDSIELRQDPDVLDTWFSSALWPFVTLDWQKESEYFNKYYPTSVLVTGFDIIFFWVARMIMMGIKMTGKVPFHEVYVHGLIRDSQGQKMSKSKGNILDPLDLIDGISLDDLIKKRTSGLMLSNLEDTIVKKTTEDFPNGIKAYGADPLRITLANLATTGRDINLSMQHVESNRNFCNKIWNACNYINSLKIAESNIENIKAGISDQWIQSKLDQLIENSHKYMKTHRIDLLSKEIYEFLWHEYCDWYIEIAKIIINSKNYDEQYKYYVYSNLKKIFSSSLIILHPIAPFITEELFLKLNGTSILKNIYPSLSKQESNDEIKDFENIKNIILSIRQARSENQISPKSQLLAYFETQTYKLSSESKNLIKLMCNLSELNDHSSDFRLPIACVSNGAKVILEAFGKIDIKSELNRTTKNLERVQLELQSIGSKLANKKFLERAPKEVIEQNKKLQSDLSIKLKMLTDERDKLSTLDT